MNKKAHTPLVATHPDEMIKDELKERGMTQKQLAIETGIKPSVLSETINGKRSVSLSVVIILERARPKRNYIGVCDFQIFKNYLFLIFRQDLPSFSISS